MAPEMLRNEGYDFLADVWSIGSVAYLLVFGSFPYSPSEANAPAMKKAIIEDSPPLKFPSLSGRPTESELLLSKRLRRCARCGEGPRS